MQCLSFARLFYHHPNLAGALTVVWDLAKLSRAVFCKEHQMCYSPRATLISLLRNNVLWFVLHHVWWFNARHRIFTKQWWMNSKQLGTLRFDRSEATKTSLGQVFLITGEWLAAWTSLSHLLSLPQQLTLCLWSQQLTLETRLREMKIQFEKNCATWRHDCISCTLHSTALFLLLFLGKKLLIEFRHWFPRLT